MLNRNLFFTNYATVTPSQREGIEAIFDEYERQKITDLRQLAYILATVKHETADTMQPIEEYGKGHGRPYGEKRKQSGAKYSDPDQLYYGRGFVQLTWYENYDRAGNELEIELLEQPELALRLDIASMILVKGMVEGWFTGKKLNDYINSRFADYTNARRIINGTDRAVIVAGYAVKFAKCLQEL